MRALLAATVMFAAAGALLLTALLTRGSSADLDPPGPPVENDWLAFTNLTFVKDAGDGGGTAEICVDVRFTHPGHSLGSDAADWLRFDCWDVVMDEGNPVSNGAPLVTPYTLVGTGGKVDQWLSAVHRECFPTAPWEFRVRVTEIEGSGASAVLAAVGKAIGQGKDPRMLMTGALLEAVATILDKLFGGEENIGTGQQNFAGGEGDPNGEVEKGGSTDYFNYKVKKVVKSEPGVEPNPCQVGTPTPTPTATPTPTPSPTPCPNDNDCDGVLNTVEQFFESDQNDPQSTPEDIDYDPNTCIDTEDNDGDTLADLADPGCQHLLGRAAGAGVDPDLEEAPFGFDLDHPFSKSEALAASSWVALIQAANGIDGVTAEEGSSVAAGDIAEERDTLRELVGAVAHGIADAEVREADAGGGFAQSDLDMAYDLIMQADALVESSIEKDSTSDLLDAIELYRQAFEMFVADLHPEFNEGARGDVNCDETADARDSLALLRYIVGLGDGPPECLYNGDLNCNTVFDAIDALFGLRHVVGLPLLLADGCPAVLD